jgi:carbonic anhydrase
MLTFTNDDLRQKLKSEHPEAAKEIESIDFLPFPDLDKSVEDDVQLLKTDPLVNKGGAITGWVYEVETGKVCKTSNGHSRSDAYPLID